MKTKSFVIFALFSFFCGLFLVGYAATNSAGSCQGQSITGKKVMVIFVNGILNDRQQARCSADALRGRLVSGVMSKDSFDYDYQYNPTNGFISINCITCQALPYL